MNVDLSTAYLGLKLRNPLVIAASPLTNELTNLQRLEQAGASAAVLSSLFQEQIEHEELELDRQRGSRFRPYGDSISYFPELEDYNTGPDGYLRHVAAAKRVASIPIIGSLNGTMCGSWTRFARLIQEEGADALELNMYHLAADPTRSAADVEQRYLELAAAVRAEVSIPLAVKLGPSFSSLPNMVHRLVEAGIDGIVLFNRFAQPDLDLDTMEIQPRLVLSRRDESRLSLRWIAILRDQTPVSLAATGGVHTAEDVLKMLLVGADVTMMASALFQHGPKYLAEVLADLNCLMEQKGFESVERIKGLASLRHCPDPTAFERSHYMKNIASFTQQPADDESLAPMNVGAPRGDFAFGPYRGPRRFRETKVATMTTGPIIFATDFSPGSAGGWPIAQMLARATKAALLVVHVAPGEPTARLGPFYASLRDPNVSAVARQLVESASVPPDIACDHRILEGDPAAEIVRFAREESAAMIVIGTHGRTGAKRLLMGSVAEAVVRTAPCPVVVCREPDGAGT